MHYDIAVIGGGPAGSTLGTLIKKYRPELTVAIFEREVFPRDHIGESQLPGISAILDEMGVWDKVEAAGFPIKLGATLLWGRSKELWDLDFYPSKEFKDEPRPAKYVGQRRSTAFQVDRAIYDKILLDHAQEMGVEVYQPQGVAKVEHEGDVVTGLTLKNGEQITATHYVDASGNAAILRKALGVRTHIPTRLKNVAFWDYWQNADWAETIGVGGTRIQVMSIGHGWLWFIPLGPTRTSIGFVTSADYYKSCGLRPEQLYDDALARCPRIMDLLQHASRENKFEGTSDWSFVAERTHGSNWYLLGESAGFADPVLAAGLMLTHHAAKELAYTLCEIDRGALDGEWLRAQFSERQVRRLGAHIRFADFWYSSNAQLKELKEYTAEIAKDQGLNLEPDAAWRWLALGGFIDDDLNAGTGSFSIEFIESMGEFLSELKVESPLRTCNVFDMDLEGATVCDRPHYEKGRVSKTRMYVRGDKRWPIDGVFGLLHANLSQNREIRKIVDRLMADVEGLRRTHPELRQKVILNAFRALEVLCLDGWVKGEMSPTVETLDLSIQYRYAKWHED